ncbi:MAG TPA: hypothetical protein VKU19_18300 [Bryobacteraceae bacterium]|nr:hypothetical protein [Bryobacteraceae bacterium]
MLDFRSVPAALDVRGLRLFVHPSSSSLVAAHEKGAVAQTLTLLRVKNRQKQFDIDRSPLVVYCYERFAVCGTQHSADNIANLQLVKFVHALHGREEPINVLSGFGI